MPQKRVQTEAAYQHVWPRGHCRELGFSFVVFCLFVLCGIGSHGKILCKGQARSDFCFLKEKYRSLAPILKPH